MRFMSLQIRWQSESTSIFLHKWHHLSSLSFEFSMFEDVGGWQPWRFHLPGSIVDDITLGSPYLSYEELCSETKYNPYHTN